MSTQSRIAQRSYLVGFAVAVGLATPTICGAQFAEPGRMLLELETSGDSPVQLITAGNDQGRDLMVYRFRIEAAERGIAAGAGESWEVAILFGDYRTDGGVRLTAHSADVTFPRPLGLRVGAGDSLRVLVSFPGGAPRALTLRLEIDYEPLDRPQSRIGVVAVNARPSVESTVAGSWDWTEVDGGRLLAIAGLPIGAASSVTLYDVESGKTLWSSTRRSELRAAFGAVGGTVRLGVPLVAGRTYRLTVNFKVAADDTDGAVASDDASETDGVVAMILPAAQLR